MTKIDDLWNEAQLTGESVDIGDLVICDWCGEDYTSRADVGGYIFGSKGTCPACAEKLMVGIIKHNEQHYIKATCPENMSFADFIRKYRKDHDCNFIKITHG